MSYVNWLEAERFSSVTDPTSVQDLLFLIPKLRNLILLKREEVVKGGLLKVHAKFAWNQIVFINIYTSIVGKGRLCFFKNTGYSFSMYRPAFWLEKVGFHCTINEIQMETIWRLILFLSKNLLLSLTCQRWMERFQSLAEQCSSNPSASQKVFGKHWWA